MNYASSREIDASEIPVIDIGDLVAGRQGALAVVGAQLEAAARDPGFFYVRGHGVSQQLTDSVRALSREFFAQSMDRKQQVAVNDRHRGFLATGAARMYPGARPDLKESYVFGLELSPRQYAEERAAGNPLLGPNNWPEFMPGLRPALTAWYAAMGGCATLLLRACAVTMGFAPEQFVGRVNRPVSRGSIIYYPPQPETLGTEQFGVGPHTDYGCLTLVSQDDTGGLEVLGSDGEWLTAKPIPATLVVNVGDLLARWSNDRFRSTPHRVINKSGGARYSMAFFFDPDFDTVIDPAAIVVGAETPHYPPVTCGDYILSRYAQAFDYRESPDA